MTFVVGPSRKGSLVSRTYALMKRDAAAEKRAAKKAPPPEVEPAKPAKGKRRAVKK